MDLRLKQDQLTTTLEEADRRERQVLKDEVEDKLTSKFEELTDNLTIALDAVKADDKDFKACIQKCEDGMDVLRASKSDKTEIADLRAQLTAQLQVVQKTASAAAIPPEVAEELATCLRRDEVVPMLEGKASTENVKQIADATARADGRLATLAEAIDSVHANTMHAVAHSTGLHQRRRDASRASALAQVDKVVMREEGGQDIGASLRAQASSPAPATRGAAPARRCACGRARRPAEPTRRRPRAQRAAGRATAPAPAAARPSRSRRAVAPGPAAPGRRARAETPAPVAPRAPAPGARARPRGRACRTCARARRGRRPCSRRNWPRRKPRPRRDGRQPHASVAVPAPTALVAAFSPPAEPTARRRRRNRRPPSASSSRCRSWRTGMASAGDGVDGAGWRPGMASGDGARGGASGMAPWGWRRHDGAGHGAGHDGAGHGPGMAPA